jgi:hypothetical protein
MYNMWNGPGNSDVAPPARVPALRTRWAAIGAAVAVTLGGVGISGYNIVNAEVTNGDRSVLVTVDPCRLADTRSSKDVGPRQLPIRATETHTFNARRSGVPCTGKIPTEATSLLLNVTALDATTDTFLTFWASGSLPTVASLNPAPGQPPTPNAVTVGLSATDEFNVYNNAGSVDVVIDVVGYYENHNHNDRYYTKAEVDQFASDSATCTALDFFPAKSSAGVRGTAGDQSLICSLDIPELAIIESFTSFIYDNSADFDGRCEVGLHVLQTREALMSPESGSTSGQSTLPHKITTTLGNQSLNDGAQFYVERTSPDDLVAVSGVTVKFRLPR